MIFTQPPIFSFLKFISTNSCNSSMPFVAVQPRIFIPSYKDPYHPNSLVGNEKMSIANTVSSGRNRLLALEFSISYNVYPKWNFLEDPNRFKLNEVEVFIEKFKKKVDFNTNFTEGFHIPQITYLPPMSHKLAGFELFVSPFVAAKNHGDFGNKCQLISLFYDEDFNVKRDVSALKHAIFCFRILMGIQLYENSKDWGFQFAIRIKEQVGHNLRYPSPFITTNMFKLIFSDNGLEVKLQTVNKKLYHTYN